MTLIIINAIALIHILGGCCALLCFSHDDPPPLPRWLDKMLDKCTDDDGYTIIGATTVVSISAAALLLWPLTCWCVAILRRRQRIAEVEQGRFIP